MTHTEWIVSVDDDLKDHDEIFVGNVRDGDRLTRCCDCVHFKSLENQFVQMTRCVVHDRCPDYTDFCSWAERKDND